MEKEKLNELLISRKLGQFRGNGTGPTVIFVAGLHGNELASVLGLQRAMDEFHEITNHPRFKMRGNVYAVVGNLKGLKKNVRYEKEDLNRLWTLRNVKDLQSDKAPLSAERHELSELLQTFEEILQENQGPFIFIDLHSTSSRTVPHIVISDELANRKLSFKFPLPVILGIESFVEGTMLAFFDEMGHRAIGFEGGIHDEEQTIDNISAFVWLSLCYTGVLRKNLVPEYKKKFEYLLSGAVGHRQVYEVFHRYPVEDTHHFEMIPGYANFQPVKKGQFLAIDGDVTVLSKSDAHIFLPRYEQQGNSGFYLLKKVTKGWLEMSAILRRGNIEKVASWIPGVEKTSGLQDAYSVKNWMARWFGVQFFHLLGYRRVLRHKGGLVLSKRCSRWESSDERI